MKLLDSVNRCQIEQMRKVGGELDPTRSDSCTVFSSHVRNVEAAIVHTYQITSYAALIQTEPKEAAQFWKNMVGFCESAISVLKEMKDIYPHCGTPELYNLALDYWSESRKRYDQNLKDSECVNQIPAGLFPTTT